jgi:hypothetical protein
MPSPCALVPSGRYAVKHNPAAYYVGDDDRAACSRDDSGVTGPEQLRPDADGGPLPTFLFVVPDLCHDTHDCSVATGDEWLASWLPSVLAGSGFAQGRIAVFIVWDEPSPMPFVALAASVHPGSVIESPVDHYSLLRTTEELLGLASLGAAAEASSMRTELGL